MALYQINYVGSIVIKVSDKTSCLTYIDGLVQNGGNPSVLAMELLQSCRKPTI